MGRFILTDKGAWDDMLHKNNEACGFRCNGYHKAEDVILRTYSKLNIDTFNYIQKGDGFAAVCGTLVYTNNTGREALELLARDLPVKNIHDIRRDCAGCFAVIYKQNDQITVFVDESAVYSVYYYHGQTFLVTNTYFHVEKCAKQPVSPAVVAEHILNGAILGNETPFKNIYRLSGSECVVYNCKTKKLYIEKVGTNTYTYQFQTYEQKISCLKGLVQKYTGYQKLFKGQHSVFGTGGWIADWFCQRIWMREFDRDLSAGTVYLKKWTTMRKTAGYGLISPGITGWHTTALTFQNKMYIQ